MSYLDTISMIHTLDDNDVISENYSYSDYKNDCLMIESSMYHEINKIADEMSVDSIHALCEGAIIDTEQVKDSKKYADSVKKDKTDKIIDRAIKCINSQYNKTHNIISKKIDFVDSHKNDIMNTTISNSYYKCEGKCKKVSDVSSYSKLVNKFTYTDFIKVDSSDKDSAKYKKMYNKIVADMIGAESVLTADKINSGKENYDGLVHVVSYGITTSFEYKLCCSFNPDVLPVYFLYIIFKV